MYSNVAPGIYKDSRTGHFFERPKINGRRTWRKIDAVNLKIAKEILASRRTDQTRAAHGLARDPYASPPTSVSVLCEAYEKAGCPDRRLHGRNGMQLQQEKNRLEKLIPYFRKFLSNELHPRELAKYFEFRKKDFPEGVHGGRAVDLELSTLRSVLSWAWTTGRIDSNPLAGTCPKFRKKEIAHSRDFMPKDAEELHQLAVHFFEGGEETGVFGWQVLLQAMTGCRTSELLRLCWDAENHKAGHVEGHYLWLERSKGGVNPFALIHDDLQECLRVLHVWRMARHPGNPHFLPSPRRKTAPVSKQGMGHALAAACEALEIPHRTPHGLRAYYVTVRRSQGISDGQIAAEIGDKTGPSIISAVYGDIPPNWQGREGLSWMPKGKAPAWSVFDFPGNVVALKAAK
jgi:integrase